MTDFKGESLKSFLSKDNIFDHDFC